MHSDLTCCVSIDALLLVMLALRLLIGSNLRNENGEYVGVAPMSVGRKERTNGILVFLILSATKAGIFYLTFVEPNAHAGRPVPWEMGLRWVLTSLFMGMLYIVIAAVYITKMYKPDSQTPP